MPDAPKKRPLLQLHLSTVVMLMFVAGGIVWLNCRTYPGEPWWQGSDPVAKGFNAFEDGASDGCGWPWCFWVKPVEASAPFFFDALVKDVAVAAGALFVVAFVFEQLLRRRERRRNE